MLNKLKNKFEYIKEYGLFFTIKAFYYGKSKNFKKYNNVISNKVKSIYIDKAYTNEKIEVQEDNIKKYKDKVWVLWWQGMENAPELIKICMSNKKKYIKDREIIILTKDNLKKYVQLPEYLLEKFKCGGGSIQHLSDIIRIYLIYYYGGVWMDATIFMNKDLDSEIFDYDFYTIKRKKLDERFISEYRWTSFFLVSKPQNILFKYLLNMQYAYWKRYNIVIDYLLLDYFIDYLYNNHTEIKNMIDSVPINNIHVDDLLPIRNDIYEKNKLKKIQESTYLYKLNWKESIDYNKKYTVYRCFIEKDK